MTKAALSETLPGTCDHCGTHDIEVYRDTLRCEECDGQFVWCSICKRDEHEDDHCRHVFQTADLEWRGAGIGINEAVRPSLFRLLDLMPDGFAADLSTAIKSRRFHTWMIAPLIGGGGMLELNGMPERDGKSMLFEWGYALIKIGEGDHAEETAEGYRWLVSLYDGKTLKANRA
ncbi:MAG: hypothetical protein K9G48_12635, partial [Reyranella sp.]|nr:hypothetical protein [Reyranella sp.]